jgi:hypothetical protein
MDSQFWWGVGASVLAAFICFVIVQIKTRALLSWSTFSLFWSITKRMKATGVSGFFATRADYSRCRKEKTIGEYIRTAEKELIYVGFWLAHGVEMENILQEIERLLNRCPVELVFLDQNLSDELGEKIAGYLGMPPANLKSRLQNAWSDVLSFREKLPSDMKSRFAVRRHREFTASSAFIFDSGGEQAKTLVDFKLFGAGRASSFGIELRSGGGDDCLYRRITGSFHEIRKKSEMA